MHQPYPPEEGKGTLTTTLKNRDNQAARYNYQALFRFPFNIFRYQVILNKHAHNADKVLVPLSSQIPSDQPKD